MLKAEPCRVPRAADGRKGGVFPFSSSQCHGLFHGVVPARVSRNELREAHHQSSGGKGCAGKMVAAYAPELDREPVWVVVIHWEQFFGPQDPRFADYCG